jgi:hypothetical protein
MRLVRSPRTGRFAPVDLQALLTTITQIEETRCTRAGGIGKTLDFVGPGRALFESHAPWR